MKLAILMAMSMTELMSLADVKNRLSEVVEPNGEPTTSGDGLRQATSNHCQCSEKARQAMPSTTGPHFGSAS